MKDHFHFLSLEIVSTASFRYKMFLISFFSILIFALNIPKSKTDNDHL